VGDQIKGEVVEVKRIIGALCGSALLVSGMGAALAQQQSGTVGSGAPEDIVLEVTAGEGGAIELSQTEFRLAWGGYYRFNLVCPSAGVENESGISFEAADLWQNSHLRIVSVSDPNSELEDVPEINFHMQGLQVRMIDCEGLGAAARVSFFPMRKGTYPFTVLDDTVDPPRETAGQFVVE
jgi:hypothetical protein